MPTKTTPKQAAAGAGEKPVLATPTSSQVGVANSNLDQAQVLKAFKALSAHIARRTTGVGAKSTSSLPLDGPSGNLRDPSNTVYVQITINTLSPTSHVKPVRIHLPHALHTPGQVSTCLLVKDPQRQYKDLLVAEKIKCISRVVGVAKLKGKFKPFDARRALVQEHDLFLADARIVPSLPNLCGKVFFDAKKNPITVTLTKSGAALKKELESAIQGTVFVQNKGSCLSIKIGYLAKHSPEQLTDNLMATLPAVLSRVKGGWENVHNVDVKTGNSAALPVWNSKLGIKTHVTPTEPLASTPTTPASVKNTTPKRSIDQQVQEPIPTPSNKKRAVEAPSSNSPSKSTPKKPSPRKTRAAAAKAQAIDQAATPTTPVKSTSASATPRKSASSLTRSARKAK